MKTLQLYNTTSEEVLNEHPKGKRAGIPVRWENVADDFSPDAQGENLAWAVVDNTMPSLEDTQKVVRDLREVDGVMTHGYFPVDKTPEELAPTVPEQVGRLEMRDTLGKFAVDSGLVYYQDYDGAVNDWVSILDQVKAIIAGMPETTLAEKVAKEEMQEWFDHAPTWRRDSTRILGVAAILGLSSDDVDTLFIESQGKI